MLPVEKDLANVLQKGRNFKPITGSALRMASIRFFFTTTIALSLSWIFNDAKLGGFACLAAFMALLSDDKNTLASRLGGLCLTFICVMFSAGVGLLLRDLPEGKWFLLGLCVFGAALLPLVESFWWLLGKYSLVFLFISLFDFVPNEAAILGYLFGFLLAGVVIVIDHFVWKADNLGTRPMAQLKDFIGGNKNPLYFAAISGLIVVLALWSATFFDFMQPAWVGITVIYLLDMRVHRGFIKSFQRILGTLVGYLAVMLLFPFTHDSLFLGAMIVVSAMLIPVTLPKNYTIANVVITTFILFTLDWLMKAYGGDGNLLSWRLYDTLYGVVWALIGLVVIKLMKSFENSNKQPV